MPLKKSLLSVDKKPRSRLRKPPRLRNLRPSSRELKKLSRKKLRLSRMLRISSLNLLMDQRRLRIPSATQNQRSPPPPMKLT